MLQVMVVPFRGGDWQYTASFLSSPWLNKVHLSLVESTGRQGGSEYGQQVGHVTSRYSQ